MAWQCLFDAYPPSPAAFLDPPPALRDDCLSLLSRLFELTVADRSSSCPPVPLSHLHSEGFGEDEVWEELQLLNEPFIRHLQQCVSGLQRKGGFRLLCEEREEEGSPSDEEDRASGDNDAVRSGEGEEEEEEEEEEEGLKGDEVLEGEEGETDRFFSLSEMEEFVNQADNNEGGEEEEEEYDLFRGDSDDEGSHDELHYNDFFDPPPPSTHGRREKKMKEHIARLEASSLASKPWQMSGETSAKARPENSLLEEDLAFESASRPAPEITEEVTRTVEDIIRQRIIDKAWDDVQRRHKLPERPYNYTLRRPLDQEKSKLSLAEVYEQEYLKQSAGQMKEEEEEDPRHKEIKQLMESLFLKLDALSNYHFTPKVPEPEIKTIPNVPSLTLEEVTPVGQSEATTLAPEEIQSRSEHPDIGSSERTTTDRKRERRKKKRRQQLRKLLQAKRRESGKKAASSQAPAVRSSQQFFTLLQEQVHRKMEQKRPARDHARRTSHLKL